MADESDSKAEVSAQKAYAAAAEALPGKVEPKAPPAAAPKPAKAKGSAKVPVPPLPPKPVLAEPAAAVASEPAPAPVAIEAKAVSPPAARAPARAKPPVPVKRVPVRTGKRPKRSVTAKATVAKVPSATAKIRLVAAKGPARPKPAKAPIAVKAAAAPKPKEKTMENAEFVDGLQKAATDAQSKARRAFEKSGAVLSDYAAFAKGNVKATVESGKILAGGIRSLGSELVTGGRTAFEAATSDARQLAAVKSPAEFFKLQSDILRRNFDSALSLTSKSGEAIAKLASESIAPLSGRVTLAVDKFKAAA